MNTKLTKKEFLGKLGVGLLAIPFIPRAVSGLIHTDIGSSSSGSDSYVPYTGATGDVDLGLNRLSLNGKLVGSIYRGILLDTSVAGSGRSIPLQVIYDDSSTNLTGNISGMVFTNNNTTDNSYAGLAFSSKDLAGTTLVNSFIHGVMTSHTTGAMSGDIVFGNRSLGALSESMRLKATGELTLTRNFETGVRERIFTATVTDDATANFFINNGTITNGVFAPVFGGYSESTTLWSLGFSGFTRSASDASDSSIYGILDFSTFRTTNGADALNGTLSSVVNRKIFTFRNNSVYLMTGLPNGNVIFGQNVGIGNTDSKYPLEIGTVSTQLDSFSGSITTAGISSATRQQISLEFTGATSAAGGSFFGAYSNDGASMASGDRLGGFILGGRAGTTMRNASLIHAFAEEAWSATAAGSSLVFATTLNGTVTRTDRLWIKNSGRVGNFADPVGSLHFRDAGFPVARFDRMITATTSGNFGVLTIQAQTTGNMIDGFGAALNFQIRDSAGVDNTIANIAATRSGADNSGALVFSTVNAGTATDRMRITNAGLFGINTSTPSSTAGGMDIASGGRGLVIGADSLASTRTNNTAKNAYIAGYHYTNAEEPVMMIGCESQSGVNRIIFGGGRTITNGATEYRWYMPANSTSTLGSEIMVINTSQHLGVGPFGSMDANARVHSRWNGGAQFRAEYTSGSYLDVTVDASSVASLSGSYTELQLSNFTKALSGFEVVGESRIAYDTSNYLSTTVDSTGITTLDAVGSGAKFVFSDRVEINDFGIFTRNGADYYGNVALRNTNVEGLSGIDFYDDTSTLRAGFGYGNASNSIYPDAVFFDSLGTAPILFGVNGVVNLKAFETGILIGSTTINASAKLEVNSTTQGFLLPRMTTAQKNAISTPAEGLVVYDTTLGKMCIRTASAWETVTSS